MSALTWKLSQGTEVLGDVSDAGPCDVRADVTFRKRWSTVIVHLSLEPLSKAHRRDPGHPPVVKPSPGARHGLGVSGTPCPSLGHFMLGTVTEPALTVSLKCFLLARGDSEEDRGR